MTQNSILELLYEGTAGTVSYRTKGVANWPLNRNVSWLKITF